MGTDQVTPPPGFTLDPTPSDLSDFAQQRKFRVTSTTGGPHNPGSAHYAGLAVDVGTRDKTPEEVAGLMSDAAAQGYTVRDERTQPPGQAVWTGPHIHLQKTPGAALSGGPGLVQKQSEIQPPPGFTLDPVQEPSQNVGIVGAQQPPMADKSSPFTRFTKSLANQLNPIEGIKGIAQLTAHPIDTYNADALARSGIWDEAKQRVKSGDIAGGLAKGIEAFVPFIGPAVSSAGNQFESGDMAGGIGSSVGLGLNLAGPAALKNVGIVAPKGISKGLGSTAERLYQSAMKPSTRLAPERVSGMVQTGLSEGIPVSRVGLEKLSGLVDDLNEQIAGQIKQAGPNRIISPDKAIANTQALEGRFRSQVNPTADIEAIGASREDFLNQLRESPGAPVQNLTAEEAQAMKQGTYRQLKSRSYGELKSATVEAQKALARGLKEELAAQFPEIDTLNAREGMLLQLEPAIEKAVQRITNHQIIGVGTPIAGLGVGVMTGSRPLSAVASMMKAVLDNPVVKSRLAIAISKGSAGRISLPMSQARVAGYLNALGQGENAADEQLGARLATR